MSCDDRLASHISDTVVRLTDERAAAVGLCIEVPGQGTVVQMME
jgi:hypothetical protein